MTKTDKLNLMKDRYNRLNGSIKNTKNPGIVRKLRRQIYKAEQSI